MLTAKEARKKSNENKLVQEALQKSIKWTLESVERAINYGGDYVAIQNASWRTEDDDVHFISEEMVFQELQKLGYKKYTKPVYSNGYLQTSFFITWY